MKSRYGFCLLSICWIGLAGCANWQSRAGSMSSPGSAASLTSVPAPIGSPMIQGSRATFGEPPPPVPPGQFDSGMNLAPLGSPPPQKLDLAAPVDEETPRNDKMYNLDSSRKSSSKSVASSPKAVEKKSGTLSRLAGKAGTDQKSEVASSKGGLSTISRLSKDASKEPEPKVAASTTVSKSDTDALPVPKQAKAAEETAPEEPAEIVDTTLLAQPVRKGADSESSGGNGKGPQSRVMQKPNLYKNGNKPAIYPVSNPVVEEPVNIIEFS